MVYLNRLLVVFSLLLWQNSSRLSEMLDQLYLYMYMSNIRMCSFILFAVLDISVRRLL